MSSLQLSSIHVVLIALPPLPTVPLSMPIYPFSYVALNWMYVLPYHGSSFLLQI